MSTVILRIQVINEGQHQQKTLKTHTSTPVSQVKAELKGKLGLTDLNGWALKANNIWLDDTKPIGAYNVSSSTDIEFRKRMVENGRVATPTTRSKASLSSVFSALSKKSTDKLTSALADCRKKGTYLNGADKDGFNPLHKCCVSG